MITYAIQTKPLLQQDAEGYVVFVSQEHAVDRELKELQKQFGGLKHVIKKHAFKGAKGTSVVVQGHHNEKLHYLFVMGVGSKKDKNVESYRRALGSAIRLAEKHKCTSLALQMPPASWFGVTAEQLGQEATTILHMAAYHFDEYLSEKKQHAYDLVFVVDEKNKKAFNKGFKEGKIIGAAVNEARFWIDMPPEALTPIELASRAKAIAKKHGLKFTEFKEAEIIKKGMGGLAAVSKGSERDCHLVILEYQAKKKNAPTLGFVGKGITFDSGGLSLKPPQYMETMKEDMSGAAAVLATIDALAQLQPPVNIVAVLPLSENLPSGKATKPGDIIRFYNGKTAEVLNTDAEGRLILADALAYAVKHYDLDALVDVATLTGACAYALGPFFTGMMSQHPSLAKQVQEAADHTGDRVWPLPLDDDYKVAIKSKVADICNIGSNTYKAGSITAGFFLQNFVEDTPWVHLDIAGTAYNVPDIPYYRPGATGAAVRLLIELARHWKQ